MLEKILKNFEGFDFLKADGFDDAIIGLDEQSMRLIYSMSKCIEILKNDMTEEEALEYFYFNVSGSFMDLKTPIWCYDYF